MHLLAFNSSQFEEEAHTAFESVGPEKGALTPFQPDLPPPLRTAHHIWVFSEAVFLDEPSLVVLSCNVNCDRAAVRLSSPYSEFI